MTVKNSLVFPSDNLSLLCSLWTRKMFNPDHLRAQLKSIWKTERRFEFEKVGQNLFLLIFYLEEDLELVMEGKSCLFIW